MDATIERIAAYAGALKVEALPQTAVHETKRRIIDSLGCALAARLLPAIPVASALKRLWNVDREAKAGIVFDVLRIEESTQDV